MTTTGFLNYNYVRFLFVLCNIHQHQCITVITSSIISLLFIPTILSMFCMYDMESYTPFMSIQVCM